MLENNHPLEEVDSAPDSEKDVSDVDDASTDGSNKSNHENR